MVKRILQYFRRETVLSAALICALLFPAAPAVGHTLARHRHDDTADALLADDDCCGIPAYGRTGCRQPETHPACDDAPRTFSGDGGAVLRTLNAGDE